MSAVNIMVDRTYQRDWQQRNKDKCAKYGAEYRARQKVIKDRYKAAHPDRVRASKKAWFDKNPDYLRSHYVKNRLRNLLNHAKIRAKRKGVPFAITKEHVSVPDFCPVLGIPILHNTRGGFNPNSASIDRIIPALGYVPGNVVVISLRANLLKRDGTAEELAKIALWLAAETARVKAEVGHGET